MINSIKTSLKKISCIFGKFQFSRGSEGYDNIQQWLVKSMFPKHSFGVIYGKSGSRKSFIAIDISCSIATGSKWQNRNTQAGAVVYVASEGQIGMSRRVRAWEIVNNKNVEHLYILGQSVLMSDELTRNDLIDSINKIEIENDVKVELIVLDTLARNFEGDENSSDAMGKFIRGCDFVKEVTDSSILCIHHSGKDTSKGGRGSSALVGACDVEFQVTHDTKTGFTTLSNTKQKDACAAPDLVFEFKPIDLGFTCEEGEPVTSLALLANAKLRVDTTWNDDVVLKGLNERFDGCSTRAELRSIFPVPEGIKPKSVSKNFSRKIDALVEAGKITVKQKGDKASPTDIITAVKQHEFSDF
ncbi:Cro/Cl family transcriptional regulator [Vibrio parahaemolyticus]|uniref:helicase RepA family protein n=1 Tax=Vibrio cholerae TaxID=666 RepID=UPI001D3BB0E7|nr:AAA family ATPase [Vibrio parahaemolyticus]EJV9309686.1 AAA family ATPase [Vibrio vulnificus]EGQ8952239.1 AAA family ATPase [Vibrio parahaemolyticus]EGQ8972107.1 AAA family ATPase [Vibrio parahaemolyticus]EGR3506637.1 Cro/Cl family transcriptional regulator [Vibrio parahaemolyticus]